MSQPIINIQYRII